MSQQLMHQPPLPAGRPGGFPWLRFALGALLLLLVFGVARSSLLVGVLLAGQSLGIAVLLAMGAWVPSAPPITRTLLGVARRAPAYIAAGLMIVFGGSVLGSLVHLQDSRGPSSAQVNDPEVCAAAQRDAAAQVASDNLDAARAALRGARNTCDPSAVAALDALERDLAAKETARKERDEQERAAAREREAVATFPAESDRVRAKLGLTGNMIKTAKWDLAEEELAAAEKILDGFKGTSVETTKAWAELAAKGASQRKQLQPHLDRLRAERGKAQAKAEAEAVVRGRKPVCGAGMGCVPVTMYLKEVLHDPDSYEHVESSDPVAQGTYWVIQTRYRAKNVLGAKVLKTSTFFVQQDFVVRVE